MKEELSILGEWLQKCRTDYYSQLNPALTESEIAALESKYGVKLSSDLIALYSWRNGQNEDCAEALVNNSMFLPLETVLDTARELNGMKEPDFETENWWNRNWLPLFHNGGGDYICYDPSGTFTGQQGQLIEFWHADGDRNVIAPDLSTFLAKINDYYGSTSPSDFDEYFEIENIDGFPKSFIVNNTTGNKSAEETDKPWWKKMFG